MIDAKHMETSTMQTSTMDKLERVDGETLWLQALDRLHNGDAVGAALCCRRLIAVRRDHAQAYYLLGALRVEAGEYEAALDPLRTSVELLPNLVEGHSALGEALAALGRQREAADCLMTAIALRPDFGLACYNLGNVFRQLNRIADAGDQYRRAATLQPDFMPAHYNLALALRDLGDLEGAVRALASALRLSPDFAPAHFNLGLLFEAQGRVAEAVDRYLRAIRLQSDLSESHFRLGHLLLARGDSAGALAAFEAVSALEPTHEYAWINRAAILQSRHDVEGACVTLVDAAQILPDSALIQYNLGLIHVAQSRFVEACGHLRRAVELQPNYVDALYSLGCTLRLIGQQDAAIASLQRATALAPDHTDAHNNLGVELYAAHRFDEAVKHYRRVVELAPANAPAHVNLAIALLLLGHRKEGEAEYEWRLRCPEYNPYRFSEPQWKGELMPAGTLLVWAEQGFGDTFQFARFLSVVRARVGRLVLQCQPEVACLMHRLPGIDVIVPRCASDAYVGPEFDAQISLMSLPTVLDEVATAAVTPPYLRVDVNRAAQWHARMKEYTGLRVGLVWAGRPTHFNDCNRSIPLDAFAPLLAIDHMTLFSLQKGVAARQREAISGGGRIVPLADLCHDFEDLAAALLSLDLLISVDTAAVHLASALNCPAWVLLPFLPDWRWMLDRDDTPLYSSVRLFRQPSPGAWEAVIERIAKELRTAASAAYVSAA